MHQLQEGEIDPLNQSPEHLAKLKLLAKKSSKTPVGSATPDAKQFLQEYQETVLKNQETDWLNGKSPSSRLAGKKEVSRPLFPSLQKFGNLSNVQKQSNPPDSNDKQVETVISMIRQTQITDNSQINVIGSSLETEDESNSGGLGYHDKLKISRSAFNSIMKSKAVPIVEQTETVPKTFRSPDSISPQTSGTTSSPQSASSSPISTPTFAVPIPKPQASQQKQVPKQNSFNQPAPAFLQANSIYKEQPANTQNSSKQKSGSNTSQPSNLIVESKPSNTIGFGLNPPKNNSQTGLIANNFNSLGNNANKINITNAPNNPNNIANTNPFNNTNTLGNNKNNNPSPLQPTQGINFNTNNGFSNNFQGIFNAQPQNNAFENASFLTNPQNQQVPQLNLGNAGFKRFDESSLSQNLTNPRWMQHRAELGEKLRNKPGLDERTIEILATMTFYDHQSIDINQITRRTKQIVALGTNFEQVQFKQCVSKANPINCEDRKEMGFRLQNFLEKYIRLQPKYNISQQTQDQLLEDQQMNDFWNQVKDESVASFVRYYINTSNIYAQNIEIMTNQTSYLLDKRQKIHQLLAALQEENSKYGEYQLLLKFQRIEEKQVNIMNLLQKIVGRLQNNFLSLPKHELNYELEDLKVLQSEEKYLIGEIHSWNELLQETNQGEPYKQITDAFCNCTSALGERVEMIKAVMYQTFAGTSQE